MTSTLTLSDACSPLFLFLTTFRRNSAGLSYDPSQAFYGTLRWRYFGDVPLIEDGSVEWGSSSLVNARIGYRFPNGLDLALDVFNLFDSTDSDIEYYYASRLPGEPADGVEDLTWHVVVSCA